MPCSFPARGTVAKVSDQSITVTTTVGKTVEVLLDAETTYARADKPIGYFSAVHTIAIDIPVGARAGEFEVFVGFDQTAPGAG